MSMSAPSNQHQQQPSHPPSPLSPPLRARLAREWSHWENMPSQTLALLVLPSIVLFVLSPLLPITAFLLWLWASHTIFWRDRWTTIWIWAKKCGAFIAFLVTLAFLDAAHVSIIPQVITALQTLWHTYLPGELSLSPLDTSDLLIRTLLWLPLAPALTLYYEYLDPRTEVDPRPILTPADLTKPAPLAPPPSSSTASAAPQQASTTPPATPSSQPRAKRPKSKVSPQQMTIESALGEPIQGNEATPSPAPEPHQKHAQSSPRADTAQPQQRAKKTINWDDVAE